MKMLLTGSSGFLGREIVKLNCDHTFFTLNRNSGSYKVDLHKTVPLFNETFQLVIHSAGKAHVIPDTYLEKDEFNAINVNGTLNLLKGLEISGIPQMLVFISSVSVFGLDNGYEINEQYELKAIDTYGKSKIVAEEIVIHWCNMNNVICTVLRLPLIVGPNPPGNLGFMINAIRRGYYFNISHGTAKKSMVLASDVAKYILKVAKIGGIYNLTDGCHPSFNELSNCIAKQMGRKYVPNMPLFFAKLLAVIGDLVGRKFPLNSDKLDKITSTLTFDDSKARKAFGWNPTPVLKGFKIYE